MSKITTKQIRAAAASVVGARSMGIETAASKVAPVLLAQAEAVLETLIARAAGVEPSAPDMPGEAAYGRAAGMASAFADAIDELRSALGLETRAEQQQRAAAARRAEQQQREAEATHSAEQEAAEHAALAAAEWVAEFEDALPETIRRFGECVDARGLRVAMITRVRYAEGRMSSLGGWNPGGEVIGRSHVIAAEDGRILEQGEWVAVRDGGERRVEGATLALAGVMCVPPVSAVGDWLPAERTPVLYTSDWHAESVWADAQAARRAERAAAREAAHTPAPEPERTWTLADLAALTTKRRAA